jgi:hypothetical protein
VLRNAIGFAATTGVAESRFDVVPEEGVNRLPISFRQYQAAVAPSTKRVKPTGKGA